MILNLLYLQVVKHTMAKSNTQERVQELTKLIKYKNKTFTLICAFRVKTKLQTSSSNDTETRLDRRIPRALKNKSWSLKPLFADKEIPVAVATTMNVDTD